METIRVPRVSEADSGASGEIAGATPGANSGADDAQRAEVIVEAAGRLFFAPGSGRVSMDDLARELGMSKKTIYRHFPDRRGLLTAVLDRRFAAIERKLVAAAEDAAGRPFDVRVHRFLVAAGSEMGRIGGAQLAAGRGGDAVIRRYVERRVDEVVYQRLDELFRDGHRQGLLPAPPELLGEVVRGAVERLLDSQLAHELGWSAGDLLRTTVETVLFGATRPAGTRTAAIPTARADQPAVEG